MEDLESPITSEDTDTYVEDRKRRLRRDRRTGFFVCVPLWALAVVPLARESMEGREGGKAVAVYLGVGAITLGVGAVIRGIHVLLTKRHFWSPWVFLFAAGVAIVGYFVQSAGEEVVPIAGAGVSMQSHAEQWSLGGAPGAVDPGTVH